MKEFQSRFDAWYNAANAQIKQIGDGRNRGAALNKLDSGKDAAKERIAAEMGIPVSHYYPKGSEGFAGIAGNYGLGWAGASVDDTNAQGRQFNSDGTVTDFYSRDVTWEGQALLGPQIKKLIQAGLYLDADHHTTDLVAIHYDRQGDPVSVTVTNAGQGGITFGGGIGAGEHQYNGGKAGTGGVVKTFGGPSSTHVTTTTIPLAGNPDARAIAALYQSSDGLKTPPKGQLPAGLKQALDQQTTSVQIYDRQRSNGGWDLSGTYYVEILGLGQQQVDQTQTLNTALYFDPQAGQFVPWVSCRGGQ